MEIREHQVKGNRSVEITNASLTFSSYLKFTFIAYFSIGVVVVLILFLGVIIEKFTGGGNYSGFSGLEIIFFFVSLLIYSVLILISYPVYKLVSKFHFAQRFTLREQK